MRRSAERGASTLLILLIMVLLLVAFGAAYTLSRVGGGGDERTDTQKRLAAAARALEQFAAANSRLPCPADPAGTTGVEIKDTSATCDAAVAQGTLPWATLGLTSDGGLDAWGRKISYRVYTGNKGSFTQPGGVNMVDCDINEPSVGSATAVAGSLGGLCVSGATAFDRSTSVSKFKSGKGIKVDDRGTVVDDVAFVLISHGASGLGAYTTAGNRLALPNSNDEKNNTGDETKTFTIKVFSGADIEAISPLHFDDLLVYERIEDLATRAGLAARDWPDTATSSLTFDAATVAAALGQGSVSSGDTGTASLNFGSATVTGYTGAGTETNLSFDSTGTQPGLGVAGGFSNKMSSFFGEYVRVSFTQAGAKFAMTLSDFGTYSFFGQTYTEKVQLKFYLNNVLVGSAMTLSGCNADGGLASFAVTPAGVFDAVDIIPTNSTGSGGGTWDSSMILSEIKACTAATANCKTGMATGGNTCP